MNAWHIESTQILVYYLKNYFYNLLRFPSFPLTSLENIICQLYSDINMAGYISKIKTYLPKKN